MGLYDVVVYAEEAKFRWWLNSVIYAQAAINIIRLIGDESMVGKEIDGYVFENSQILLDIDFTMKVLICTEKDRYEGIKNAIFKTYGVDKDRIIHVEDLLSVNEDGNYGEAFIDVPVGIYDINYLIRNKCINTNNYLMQYFLYGNHKQIFKFFHYFKVYDTYFHEFRNQSPRVLEIGVLGGGSLEMWSDYFGAGSQIVGIDINPECKKYEKQGISICIGSQNDKEFLQRVTDEYGPFDIVIDDGSHLSEHQITSFENLFSKMNKDGIYLCEDVHTSYLPFWDGKMGGSTFVEYAKKLIDRGLYYDFLENDEKNMVIQAEDIEFVHFYQSIVVVKRNRNGKEMSI